VVAKRLLVSLDEKILAIVNSGELGSRSDGATPIINRRTTSEDVTNFSSIDYKLADERIGNTKEWISYTESWKY
jgi:RPE2 domain-containing protein